MDIKEKIIIVEGNDVYRAALKSMIDAQDHLEVVAEANNGVEAIEIIERYPADLVLIELQLSEPSGYDILPEISKSADTKILVLNSLESDHNIRAAFEAGADGYCFKDVSSQDLLNAISSVLAGIRYIPYLP
jgi:DNA-binding NarL/FixJ family response regulator